MRILIAEDNVLVALALRASLLDAGHDVLAPVHDRSGGLELACRERLDLALIDLCLADGWSGAELVRGLREQFDVPSYILTADPEGPAITEAALGVIEKPYAMETVLNAVAVAASRATGVPPPVIAAGSHMSPEMEGEITDQPGSEIHRGQIFSGTAAKSILACWLARAGIRAQWVQGRTIAHPLDHETG